MLRSWVTACSHLTPPPLPLQVACSTLFRLLRGAGDLGTDRDRDELDELERGVGAYAADGAVDADPVGAEADAGGGVGLEAELEAEEAPPAAEPMQQRPRRAALRGRTGGCTGGRSRGRGRHGPHGQAAAAGAGGQAAADDGTQRTSYKLCCACLEALKRGQMPKTCVANSLAVQELPPQLRDLCEGEWRRCGRVGGPLRTRATGQLVMQMRMRMLARAMAHSHQHTHRWHQLWSSPVGL